MKKKKLITINVKNIKHWWYRLEHIFTLRAVFSLNQISFWFNMLPLKIKLDLDIPVHFYHHIGRAWWVKVSKNKTFEFQWFFNLSLNTGIHLDWNMHQDHAGVKLDLMLLGFTFAFEISDGRHWCEEKNAWYVYDHGKKVYTD